MTNPVQYYYPTMLVPYIPKKRTKKKHIKDFNYTYGHHFNPSEMMKPPKTRIVFNKNDDIYQFTKNTLSLYNIDYNPSFVEFSMNNFKAKIKEYLSHYRNKNLYIDSINSIRKSSELLELEKVLNEHELHLILEALDTMFEYSNFKNFKIKQDSSEVRDMHNFIMKDENFNKLQGTLVGGGNIKKFDIINYVNGNKRKEIKERIINMVYVDFENEDTMGYIYDQGWPNDFEMNLNDKKRSMINDEIMDTCFDAFVQQKIFTHLGYTDKDVNPYFRGEFQKNLKGCKDKKYYDPDFFEDKVPTWAFKRPGVEKPEAFERKPENEDFEPLDDKFEFTAGRSMINSDYLNYIINNREKHDELKELIEVYHKLQIPDTRFARNKEKMMKEYLSSISMAIIMLGMLPPSFFGEDYDFNPFDVLSTVICIFEGSTVCAVMSALPLFSPFLDMLSTFSIVRKILNKFGVTGAVGKRSQAAIKQAQQRKIAKQNAFMEKGVKLKADLSTMARNIDNAKGLQKEKLMEQFKKLKKANENYAKQSKKMAEKGVVDSMKRAKAQSKGAEKLIKQLSSGRPVKSLSAAEKAKLQRYTELLNMQKNAPNLKLPKGVGVKNVDGQLKNVEGALKGSVDGRKILNNGKKAADDSINYLTSAQNELRVISKAKTPEAAVKEFGKYETELAKINENKQMLASGVNSQGVKLSQQKLDKLNAEVKKSMDSLSPKHLVESRNYSEKQLKYLQTGTSPPVDKMARYEQSFKPSSDASISQIKKQQKRMIEANKQKMGQKIKRRASKIGGTEDAAGVSRDVQNLKAKTGVMAKQIKETRTKLKAKEDALGGRTVKEGEVSEWTAVDKEVKRLENKLKKQKAELETTMRDGIQDINFKTRNMDPSTQKMIDDATESIIGKRLKQSEIEDFTLGKKTFEQGQFKADGETWTGTLISSKADKAKVKRALRGKQLKASEDSIQKAREAKFKIKDLEEAHRTNLNEILGKNVQGVDYDGIIKTLDVNTDAYKITRIKALQAEMKAAEAQSKYAAAVARKNFDKVITGQTKKRFYDFRTWGKEGRTKRLNNFKRAQVDAKTGKQIDLLKDIDDVVTPGLTRVKNKDVKYFKAQAEVAEQEAKLATQEAKLAEATAKKETFLKKIADEKEAALKKFNEKPRPYSKANNSKLEKLMAEQKAAQESLENFKAVKEATNASRRLEKAKIQNLRNKQVLKKLEKQEKNLKKQLQKAQKSQDIIKVGEMPSNKISTQIKNLNAQKDKLRKQITDYELTIKSKRTKKLKQTLKEKEKLLKEKERPSIVYKVRQDMERKGMVESLKSNIARIESRTVASPKTSRNVRRTARQEVKELDKKINMDEVGLDFNQMKEFGNIQKEIGAARLKVQMADKGVKNIYRTGPSRLRSFKKGRLRRTMERNQIKLQKRFDAISDKHSKAQAEFKNYNTQLKGLQNQLKTSQAKLANNAADAAADAAKVANNLKVAEAEKLLREEALQTSIAVLEKKKNLAQARIAQRQQEYLEAAQGSFTLTPWKKFKTTKKGVKKAKNTAKNELSKMFKDKGIKSKKTFEKGLEKLDKSIKKQKEINKELGILRKAELTPENLRRIELLESKLGLELARTNQNFKRIQSGSKKFFGETFYPKSFEKKIKQATQLELDKVADMSADLAKLEKQTGDIIKEFGIKSDEATKAMKEYATQFEALKIQRGVVKDVKMAQFRAKAVEKAKGRLKKSEKALDKEILSAMKDAEKLSKNEILNKKMNDALKKWKENKKLTDEDWSQIARLGLGGTGGGLAVGYMSGALAAAIQPGIITAASASGYGALVAAGLMAATAGVKKYKRIGIANTDIINYMKKEGLLEELTKIPGFKKDKYFLLSRKVASNQTELLAEQARLVKASPNVPPGTVNSRILNEARKATEVDMFANNAVATLGKRWNNSTHRLSDPNTYLTGMNIRMFNNPTVERLAKEAKAAAAEAAEAAAAAKAAATTEKAAEAVAEAERLARDATKKAFSEGAPIRRDYFNASTDYKIAKQNYDRVAAELKKQEGFMESTRQMELKAQANKLTKQTAAEKARIAAAEKEALELSQKMREFERKEQVIREQIDKLRGQLPVTDTVPTRQGRLSKEQLVSWEKKEKLQKFPSRAEKEKLLADAEEARKQAESLKGQIQSKRNELLRMREGGYTTQPTKSRKYSKTITESQEGEFEAYESVLSEKLGFMRNSREKTIKGLREDLALKKQKMEEARIYFDEDAARIASETDPSKAKLLEAAKKKQAVANAQNLAAKEGERLAKEAKRLAEAAERAEEALQLEKARIAEEALQLEKARIAAEAETARRVASEQEFSELKKMFEKKAAIESGEEAGRSMREIKEQISETRQNIENLKDAGTAEAAVLKEKLSRLEGQEQLLIYRSNKGKQLEMTQAERTMDGALEAVESKLEILKLQEAVKPVVPPMERLQQFLDNLADAYLVKYNIEEEYQHIQDVEFDKQCADANNRLLENIWSKNGQDAFLKFGTMMGGSIGDMGGVFTALHAFQKQSRFLQSFDLSEEEKENRIQQLRHGKHKKGISDREKERRISYGTAMAEDSFLRKKKKSKNKLSDFEKLNLENAKLNARLESNQLSYEELDDVMDTHTEDYLEDERFNESKMSEVDELIREDLGKQTYQLRSSQSDRVEKEMVKELRDKRRIKRRVDRKRLKEFEEEQESLEEGNEMKVLLPGESKTSTPRMRIEGVTATQSENTSAGRFISTGRRDREVNISNENNNSTTIGGGKKKPPELILRNDVLNDSQLRKELDKFAVDYKGYMAEFNKPLEELMKRRSDYKIKQKLTLKENFLKIYRDTKSEAFQEVQDIKKLEFETFEQQNNYYTKQKKQLFKAISSTGGNAFMILNVQLGTFNKTKTLVEEIEKLELKMNKMIEDKEISEFIRNFDKILEKIGKKEVEIKKIKRDIQEFKAKDADLDKLLKELAVLEKERKNYKADTNKKKTYTKMASKLRILAKELLESQELVNLYDTFKKKKMGFNVFRNNKKGQFDSLKKMLIDEIKYIKNEYDIAKFFSLGLSGIKKLTLVEVLQSIYLDIFKVRKSFEVINEFYEKENPKINKEIKSGEEQINFYYRTREKIILKEDKGLFEKRYENRKKNLKLLRELQINLVNDHVDNLNIIDKCNDLLFYCDFNINNIKNINIIQETKTKILTDKNGLIDINELHEKQLDRGINLTYKELSDILDDILSYRKIINSSRIKLKKSITDKHIKKGQITKVFLEEKKKGETEKKKEIHDQLKTVDKRLMDYEGINIDYMTFEKPIDLLIFYKILDSEINLEGKMEYTFNKLGCEMRDIKVDLILEEKLKSINTFINTHEIV